MWVGIDAVLTVTHAMALDGEAVSLKLFMLVGCVVGLTVLHCGATSATPAPASAYALASAQAKPKASRAVAS